MEKFNDGRRYPFVLTDDAGYVLFSSFPLGMSVGDNVFSSENFSASDIKLAIKRIKEYKYGNLILLRSKKDGNAVFLVPFLFPSCRTLVFVHTDISYGIAADLCTLHHEDIAFGERKAVKLTVKHERIYSSLERIIYSLKIMFLPECDASYSFGAFLSDKVNELSLLTFCETAADLSEIYISSPPENFDGSIFSLYMLIMLSAASESSPSRHADIKLTVRDNDISASIVFDVPADSKALSSFEARFKSAVRKLDEVCERLNMPTYFIKDGKFKTGIIPTRIDCALMGVKAGKGYLKDKENEENYQRNIFTVLPFSIEQ